MKNIFTAAAAIVALSFASTAVMADELARRADDAAGAVALSVLQQNPQGDVFGVQISGGVATYDGNSGGAVMIGTNFTADLYGNVGVFTGFDGEDVGVAASVTYSF